MAALWELDDVGFPEEILQDYQLDTSLRELNKKPKGKVDNNFLLADSSNLFLGVERERRIEFSCLLDFIKEKVEPAAII